MTASFVLTGPVAPLFFEPGAIPASCSRRCCSCEMRSSSVPEPVAYLDSSNSRAALSAEMMKLAVPSALEG